MEKLMVDPIVDMFNKLLVNPGEEMKSNFLEISASKNIVGTLACFSCHMVRFDLMGKSRIQEIAKYLSTRIIEYAIPKKKIKEAKEYHNLTGSTEKYISLFKEAKGLFTDLKNTGECGEVLLYIFTNTFLKIPQVLCKMSFKTSSRLHYQGVDGLHAKYDEQNDQLFLYWGESKVHSDLQQAFTDCFNSISSLLLSDVSTGSPAERDLHLFRDNIDLGSDVLEKFILSYLDPNDEKSLKLVHSGICLIGFDEEAYKETTEEKIKDELSKNIVKWESSLLTRLKNKKLEKITFHIFLIPFPSVEEYRKAFLEELGK